MSNITDNSSNTTYIYYLYQITNLVNGKLYIGVHKHISNKPDNYMGSGKLLNKAIKKHGVHNFKKEILEYFESEYDMYYREAEIVNQEFIDRRDTYNIKLGGIGGWGIDTQAIKEKYGDNFYSKIGSIGANTFHSKNCEELKIIYKKVTETFNNKYGKCFRIKQGEKTQRILKNKQGKNYLKGINNPNYNKIWITNGIINKKISKDNIIPDGYYKGRKI